MWEVKDTNIKMTVGDYGVALPFNFHDITISSGDAMLVTIKRFPNGAAKIEKSFFEITGGKIDLVFTAEESAELPVGKYVYSLDWYHDGAFKCCLIDKARFEVVGKA